MPTITIRQFRATLAGGPERSALVRAYRRLSRRPELLAAMRAAGWMEWAGAASPRAIARRG